MRTSFYLPIASISPVGGDMKVLPCPAEGGPWLDGCCGLSLNPNPPMDRDGRREDSGRG